MATFTSRSFRLSVRIGHGAEAGAGLTRAAYWLSGALALVAAAGTGATAFIPGALRGLPAMNGSARGTALVLLLVTVPVLVIAMLFVARGSIAAVLVWIGTLAHVPYNSVLLLFATPFNSLFPLYVAMFSLALFSAVLVVRQVDVEDLRARFSPRLPVRPDHQPDLRPGPRVLAPTHGAGRGLALAAPGLGVPRRGVMTTPARKPGRT